MDMMTTAAPANQAWRNSPYTRAKKYRAMAMRSHLLQIFPKAFMPFDAPKIPLKVGIRQDIMTSHPQLAWKAVNAALEDYCGGRSYLRAMIPGAVRIDLDGIPVDVVTIDQAARAAEQLRLLEVLP
jgi:sRNA-binding protein